MANKSQQSREVRNSQNERIDVIYRKLKPIERSVGIYTPLAPCVTEEDGIRIERDVAVPMRDGTTIYTDIYRPDGATNVPAIVAWSPYGKNFGYASLARRSGVPQATDYPVSMMLFPDTSHLVPPGTTSPMTKFEAPDPAYWCYYGYAVINPDARGAGSSEGDVAYWGTSEAKDGYDLIEWVAAQDWSSGRVALSGNSWLAASQWFIAAERPPHLIAIAPWEGCCDVYREFICKGGIPETGFSDGLTEVIHGHGRVEDVLAMIRKYPLMNGYWEEKIARVENIEIPAYVVASWNSGLHTRGTLRGYRQMASSNKWLRVHNTQEWHDYYRPENLEDLRRFFDRYLKGIRNGWEYTPRVRLSVFDPGGIDQVNRPEDEFPLARTQYQKLFLDANTGQLSPNPVEQESSTRYESNEGLAAFTIRFDEDTELTGYMKLHLWVEADGADDMDLFVYVAKLDEQGNLLKAPGINGPIGPAPIARGQMRVSHRELDEARSTPYQPFLTHRHEQLLRPKEIVPVEIEIWPTSMCWHTGQRLGVVVAGHFIALEPNFMPHGWDLRNRGNHIIHTGGKYDSHLLVPKIP